MATTRMDISTMLGHAKNLLREGSNEDSNLVRLLNVASNEISMELEGLPIQQVVITQTVAANSTTIDVDQSATTAKWIAVKPITITFKNSDGIRYTPQWLDYKDFEQEIKGRQKQGNLTGFPQFWSYSELDGAGGVAKLHVFPKTHVQLTMKALCNFHPHYVTSTANWIPANRVTEHLLILGMAYYGSRVLREDLSILYTREYRDAIKILKQAFSKLTEYRSRMFDKAYLTRQPRMRMFGTAAQAAWDGYPPIPYDPDNPEGGRTY